MLKVVLRTSVSTFILLIFVANVVRGQSFESNFPRDWNGKPDLNASFTT